MLKFFNYGNSSSGRDATFHVFVIIETYATEEFFVFVKDVDVWRRMVALKPDKEKAALSFASHIYGRK